MCTSFLWMSRNAYLVWHSSKLVSVHCCYTECLQKSLEVGHLWLLPQWCSKWKRCWHRHSLQCWWPCLGSTANLMNAVRHVKRIWELKVCVLICRQHFSPCYVDNRVYSIEQCICAFQHGQNFVLLEDVALSIVACIYNSACLHCKDPLQNTVYAFAFSFCTDYNDGL